MVLAQVFVAAPFFIRSARSGFATVDRDLEDAARVDGAGERQVFRWITVPLAGSALAAGLVMSWARALGESGATIMFAGNIAGRTQTLPRVVYGEFQGGDLDAAIAAAAVLVMAAFGVLVAAQSAVPRIGAGPSTSGPAPDHTWPAASPRDMQAVIRRKGRTIVAPGASRQEACHLIEQRRDP